MHVSWRFVARSAFGVLALSAPLPSPPAHAAAPSPKAAPSHAVDAPERRVAGADEFGTAAAISADVFSSGVAVAYVATSAAFADALAGGAAAAAGGGPVLLTTRDSLPASTASELRRLDPDQIVVLGGTAAVSDAVQAAAISDAVASTLGRVAPTTRVAGTDRYLTAAAVSERFIGPGVAVTYVANGVGFTDALAAGPAAAFAGGSLVLAGTDFLPYAVRTEVGRQDPAEIVRVGRFETMIVSFLPDIRSPRPADDWRVRAIAAGIYLTIDSLEALGVDHPATFVYVGPHEFLNESWQEHHPGSTAVDNGNWASGDEAYHNELYDDETLASLSPEDQQKMKLLARFSMTGSAAHEYSHNVQYALGEASGPYWFVEGQAMYYDRTARGHVAEFAEEMVRADAVAWERAARAGSLEDLEENPGLDPDNYALMLLAGERLVDLTSQAALWEFEASLTGGSWEAAFEGAFGMTSDEFYADFEAWFADGPHPL
jgi:hypothetical protein